MHSHISAVDGGLSTYLHVLGSSECQNAHRYKTIKIFNHVVDKLKSNGTTSISLTLHGYVGMDGSCEGISYVKDRRNYKKAIAIASLKI